MYKLDLEKQMVDSDFCFEGHQDIISQIEVVENEPIFFSSSVDGTVRRWDTRTGVGDVLYKSLQDRFWALSYVHDQQSLFVGGESGNLYHLII